MYPFLSQLTPGFYSKLNAVCDIAVLGYLLRNYSHLSRWPGCRSAPSCVGRVHRHRVVLGSRSDPLLRSLGAPRCRRRSRPAGGVCSSAWWSSSISSACCCPTVCRCRVRDASSSVATPALVALRLLVFRGLYASEKPEDLNEVLIVGSGVSPRRPQTISRSKAVATSSASCRCLARKTTPSSSQAPVLGLHADIEDILKHHVVDEVYIAGNPTKCPESPPRCKP